MPAQRGVDAYLPGAAPGCPQHSPVEKLMLDTKSFRRKGKIDYVGWTIPSAAGLLPCKQGRGVCFVEMGMPAGVPNCQQPGCPAAGSPGFLPYRNQFKPRIRGRGVEVTVNVHGIWMRGPESNRRPSPYEDDELPTVLPRIKSVAITARYPSPTWRLKFPLLRSFTGPKPRPCGDDLITDPSPV